MTSSSDLLGVRDRVREFVAARDWEQFHNPKNLSMALSREAGELLEIFQWLTAEEAEAIMGDVKAAQAVKDELADCLYYLVRLADRLHVDLSSAVLEKLEKNAAKYPIDGSRGSSRKYTELE